MSALDVRIDELRRAPVVTLRELARRRGMTGWAFADRDTLARRIAEDEARTTEVPPAPGVPYRPMIGALCSVAVPARALSASDILSVITSGPRVKKGRRWLLNTCSGWC